jgi:hypothetical protein
MISSTLIGEITGDLSDSKVVAKLLVLAGFCLLAAISSRAFLRSLSERVLQEVRTAKKEAEEAREEAAEAKAVVAPLVEEELPAQATMQADNAGAAARPSVTDSEKKVLKAMTSSRYSMRSLTGLARDSDHTKDAVNPIISSLLAKGLIAETKSKQGQPRWYPTALGRLIEREI